MKPLSVGAGINSISAVLPNTGTVFVEQVGNWSHGGTDGAKNSQSILYTNGSIDWTTGDGNSSCNNVSREDQESECGSGINVVRVDEIHV